MNYEIFSKIYTSDLVIVDLTEIRPNCVFEYGFAMGLNKKVICIAKDGTELPWDVSAIPCHFWDVNKPDVERIESLKEFINNNINREPIFL